jgi:4-hydroxybenzoate polyprenyltransferase
MTDPFMQPSARGTPWWLWPTVLSLDAPAVALLWQTLIAACASLRPTGPEMTVLGCSVWLAYCADRWIEGWRLMPGNIQTHRHRFHQRWRWPIAAVWAAVLLLDLTAAFRGLPPGELRAGALLLVPVAAYLLSHQLVHRNSRWRAPKEACVALLLGGGAVVFPMSRPGGHPAGLVTPLVLFVLLCFSNCALISTWERDVDRAHGQTSLALQFGAAGSLWRALPWALALALACEWHFIGQAYRPAAACALASSVLLGAVDLAQARIGRVMARVLADVALMTPAVALFIAGNR